jgi:hypothetical protein
LLGVGGLLILLSANWRDVAISPGRLGTQHALLLENGAAEPNCAACHAAAEQSLGEWTLALAGFHGNGPNQSALCMECHDGTISKEFAMAAHSVSGDELKRLTHPDMPSHALDKLACASCHREHQGAHFDLTAISDAVCQSCHQQRYESFSTDHPEFGRWPYERRTQIVFNHASHQLKHFVERKQAFDCKSCHTEGGSGAVQLLASYKTSCAACHDEKIATSVASGVPMFALPTLDIDALRAAGHDVGAWPEEATGDFDGRLPPAMKLLLAGDDAAANAIEKLGPDFEFFDVDPDDEEQLAACATLATSIKSLMTDLASSEGNAIRTRLSTVLGRTVTDAEVKTLLAGVSSDLFKAAVEQWLPALELPASNDGDTQSGDGNTKPEFLAADSSRFDLPGNWKRNDASFSIRYTPQAHADPVLAGWLELITKQSESAGLSRRDEPGGSQSDVAIAAAMLKELLSPAAPGLCASCHSTERDDRGSLVVNWTAYDRSQGPRTLTKFSHGPHVLLPQLADCTNCHVVNASADTASSYASNDPHQFVSDFSPISKQRCTECHTARASGEKCQTCHNYHVNDVESWRLETISK